MYLQLGLTKKTNTLELACGPKMIRYPLAGDDTEEGVSERVKTDKATEIANSVRVMLREKKSS